MCSCLWIVRNADDEVTPDQRRAISDAIDDLARAVFG